MAQRNTGVGAILARAEELWTGLEQIAGEAAGADQAVADPGGSGAPHIGCSVKQLPSRLIFKAAEVAWMINPINPPAFGRSAAVPDPVLPTPLAAAVVTSKYWGPQPRKLTVSFLENTPSDLRSRIISHMNAWTRTGCIEFVETQETGQVRISRGPGGYWSYLGTDILMIPDNRPTMNLQDFTMNTSDAEFRRVVRHETGHTLGMPHEHMRKELVARIDPEKAYAYYLRDQGWDRSTVDQQVLTPLDQASILATPPDQDSVMCYMIPGDVTSDGLPIHGGVDINDSDYAFIGKIYPRPPEPVKAATPERAAFHHDDWAESEDVKEIHV